MKNSLLPILLLISILTHAQEDTLINFVNPFVGTQRMGHTYPGATVPFGAVQLSPDTDTIQYEENGQYNRRVYEYCAGYQYEDSTIVGFSHTHFSGTGHSDLGDFLIMPTVGKLQLNPGTEANPETGYRSRFSHENEFAVPNYYQVFLEDYNINAEMTTSARVGFHRYTFPKTEEAHIILDLRHGIYNYDGKNVWTFVRIENDSLITGYRQTNGWARTRVVYFAMEFSKPFKNYGHKKYDQTIYRGFYRKFDEENNFPEMAGHEIRAYFDFNMDDGEELLIKFAMSSVSTEGALKNLNEEIPEWDFDAIKTAGQEQWEEELSKIKVEMMNEEDKRVFYTALYHSFLTPIIYEDVDGRYRGLDQNIHKSEHFTNYTIFSLWDTYRALHPFFNLVQADRNENMIKSMMAHYNQSVHPMLPVWSHYANENWCMIGYHSVSVIADAVMKGVYDEDLDEALEACINTATYPKYDGLEYYMEKGYVPEDKNSNSVSKTLEYAYDDWCIAQIAGITEEYEAFDDFTERSKNFFNVFNAETGFMQPKLYNGEFREEFDPLDTHGQGFIEGNAWNYGLYIPHDPERLVELMGGKDSFSSMLDTLYTKELDDAHIEANEDITRDGIIGLYVHGNEPGHHIPYLYNWTDKPWKTQERVRMICETMYADAPDGLCGNDDCGQMSAWYLFSALGFYPVCPGSEDYAIGSPLVKYAEIDMGHRRNLEIIVENQSPENVYVQEVSLNGTPIQDFNLRHREIARGGKLVFVMGSTPPEQAE
jgi:predicted alpha-1,2-mannosidase